MSPWAVFLLAGVLVALTPLWLPLPSEATTRKVTVDPDLAIAKSGAPDPVVTLARLTYSLVVTNHGPDTATGVILTDTLPAGVFVIDASPECSDDGGAIVCSLGDLAISASRTMTIAVIPAITGTITNIATVAAHEPDPIPTNNTAAITTTVVAWAAMAVEKSDFPDPVGIGNPLTYTIVVTNEGPGTATGIILTDSLPASVSFASASPGCSHTQGTVFCNLPDLPPESISTVTIVVTPTAADTITNTVLVIANEVLGRQFGEPAQTITATETTMVIVLDDLWLAKSDFPDPVIAGNPLTYTLTFGRIGASTATGVILTDTLPTSVIFHRASAGCLYGNGMVVCDIGDVASGSTATVTIVVTPTVAGVITNTATVAANEADPDPLNNTVTIATTVHPPPPPAIAAFPNPLLFGPVNIGSGLEQTVAVQNTGAGPLTIGMIPSPSAPFSLADDECSGQTLVQSASCSLSVRFSPTAGGPISRTLSIPSNDPDDNPLIVVVAGLGVALPFLLAPPNEAALSPTPTFRLRVDAPGVEVVHFAIELSTDNFATTFRTYDQLVSSLGWSKPGYTAGEEAQFTVPVSDRLPSGAYQWRARVHYHNEGARSNPSEVRRFLVPPLPEITAAPDEVINGDRRLIVIEGIDFTDGAIAMLVCRDCAEPALETITGTVVLSSSVLLRVEFDLTDPLIFGGYDLVVRNPDGEMASRPILILPYISFPYIEPQGTLRIPVIPSPALRHNYLLVGNFSNESSPSDPAFFTLVITPPAPGIVRLTVGTGGKVIWDSSQETDNSSVRILMAVTAAQEEYLWLGWGIAPEHVRFSPAIAVASDDGDLDLGAGLHLSWQGASGAAKAQIKSRITSVLINTVCQSIGDLIRGSNPALLDRAIDNVLDSLPSGFAAVDSWVIEQIAEELKGLIPGYSWVQMFRDCMKAILDPLFERWEGEAKAAADRIRASPSGRVRDASERGKAEALRLGGHRYWFAIAALQFDLGLSKPVCNPPPTQTGRGIYIISGPWDPNDKLTNSTDSCIFRKADDTMQCVRYLIPPTRATDPIEYIIQFENKPEATAPAEQVVITDVLDVALDPTSLEVVATSHPDAFQPVVIAEQTVVFRFENIDLRPNQNAPEGEGFVQFRVRPRPNLPVGTAIRNRAAIVFDFNPPIITPEVVHVIGQRIFLPRVVRTYPAQSW